MAVDANVIIFERIREELTLGKTPRAALDAGYNRATLTILDANVTTLIAAAVLFQFGTGAIKGFAVTLSMGVIASLLTSLVLSRTIFEFTLQKRKVKTISI
jgi:preprotein translocase subunit SecD